MRFKAQAHERTVVNKSVSNDILPDKQSPVCVCWVLHSNPSFLVSHKAAWQYSWPTLVYHL